MSLYDRGYAAGRDARRRARYDGRYSRRSNWGFGFAMLAAAALVIGLIAVYPVALINSKRDVTITVTDKQRVCESGGGSCKYLIFTDKGTYKDTDSLLFRKFASSDLYGNLKTGHTYRVQRTGWRIPFFSEYPNIVKIESGQ